MAKWLINKEQIKINCQRKDFFLYSLCVKSFSAAQPECMLHVNLTLTFKIHFKVLGKGKVTTFILRVQAIPDLPYRRQANSHLHKQFIKHTGEFPNYALQPFGGEPAGLERWDGWVLLWSGGLLNVRNKFSNRKIARASRLLHRYESDTQAHCSSIFSATLGRQVRREPVKNDS